MNDTIAAISTAMGVGAISIIRVSGPDAISTVNTIFSGKNLENVNSHTINYGKIVHENQIIDEVLVTVLKSPKTFTTEDIVEINCHGGIIVTKKILEILVIKGIRLAEQGEFTKRAYLNGRIDLLQAEGIMDLINSESSKATSVAISGLEGRVSKLINDLRTDLIEIISNIEVNIDYPEYDDVMVITTNILIPKIKIIEEKIYKILNESNDGKILKEGLTAAIIGRPNVGKSSLLNCLLESNKAIVTDIAGTTRDYVEGTLSIDGIALNIIDTAGIRKTTDVVESIGVNKSYELIDKADLVLFVLNNNEELQAEDKKILEQLENKTHIIIVNKKDLETKLKLPNLNNIVYISALQDEGIIDLKTKIKNMFDLEKFDKKDLTYLTNTRAIGLLNQALEILLDAKKNIELNYPIDMIEMDLKNCWDILGKITGQTYENELVDEIFSRFCLGK